MSTDDSIFKPTKEYLDMYNKISNKIDVINNLNGKIVEIKTKLKKNLSYIDDSQLKYKIKAKIEDKLSFIWFEIYKKKRKNIISSLEVNHEVNQFISLFNKCTSSISFLYNKECLLTNINNLLNIRCVISCNKSYIFFSISILYRYAKKNV